MSRYCKRWIIWLSLLVLAGCASGGPPLNSDRIAKKFGSYGVTVIEQDDRQRLSSLYSGSGESQVTRTYARVEYLGDARPEFRTEHNAILNGASIGQTFRRSGWAIRKQNLFIGELDVPDAYEQLAERMALALPETLAVHQYLFVVSNEDRSFTYARITEVHHPEYATLADLHNWYGEIILDDSNRDSIHDFIGPPRAK